MDEGGRAQTRAASRTDRVRAAWANFAPGLAVAIVLAFAASYVSGSLGGPVMLFALLFGMAFNFLADNTRIRPGLDLAGRTILRIGVVFLGARITFDQVRDLGLITLAIVFGGVVLTILVGMFVARRLGLSRDYAVLSAGAVAICGASAALAIASVLPKSNTLERETILTVVVVTALSTVAMVVYPPLTHLVGFDEQAAGIFLGATIHDVAQVVGAGYIISDPAGATATIIKLIRVMCLVPVVVLVGLAVRGAPGPRPDGTARPSLFPVFIWGFIALMVLNSLHVLPAAAVAVFGEISRWCLLVAVAALGVRTALGELVGVGPRPLIAMVIQTIFLASMVGLALVLVG